MRPRAPACSGHSGVRGSTRPRLTWAWTCRVLAQVMPGLCFPEKRKRAGTTQPATPAAAPPQASSRLAPSAPEGREGEGGGPNSPTHLLDGGLAAAPQAHEQNPPGLELSAPPGPQPPPAPAPTPLPAAAASSSPRRSRNPLGTNPPRRNCRRGASPPPRTAGTWWLEPPPPAPRDRPGQAKPGRRLPVRRRRCRRPRQPPPLCGPPPGARHS